MNAVIDNVVPGATMEYIDTPETGGVFTYKVIPYVGEFVPDSERWQYLLRGLETSFSISPYDLNFADGADVSIVRALMVERTDTIANPRSVILNGKNSYADYEATAKVDFPAVEIQDEMRSQEEIRGSLVIFC